MALISLGLIAVVAAIVHFTREHEPRYGGKALSEWCQIHSQTYGAPLGDKESREAIQHIGTNSLPYLMDWVIYGSTRYKLPPRLEIELFRLGLWKPRRSFQIDPRDEKANSAARAFGALREQATPVIPQLLNHLRATKNTVPANRIALALALIGTNTFPAIAAYISDTNAPNREFIIYNFAYYPELTTNAVPVIPALTRCLTKADRETQSAARFALEKIAEARGVPNTVSPPSSIPP